MIGHSSFSQISLGLGRLLGQDVLLAGLHSLQLAGTCLGKTFCSCAAGLHFRHSDVLLKTQMFVFISSVTA